MRKTSSSQKSSINPLLIMPKLFLIISILLLMWIVIVLSGVSILDFDPDWTGLSLSLWLLIISVLFGIFIIIDILMYSSPSLFVKGDIQEFSTNLSDEYLDGMKVFQYTFPKNRNDGIFSKTYIKIDDSTLIRIRNQMIPAESLWPEDTKEKKEEQEETET
ncbi:MAG: hypothetical protein QCI00_03890 [Candidatus Thermoplasmatota archaeon]|nr:hypothetical protein [Candidatus Thermoplasmatota archaeon]